MYESPFKDIIIGDADGDGKVTINDATDIQRFIAEMDAPEGIGTPIA